MSETADKTVRLSKVAREFNQGLHTVVEFLAAKGFKFVTVTELLAMDKPVPPKPKATPAPKAAGKPTAKQ